jgi:hypothetical protein
MAYVRKLQPGIDDRTVCEDCPQAAEIIIENHPARRGSPTLCHSCAGKDLAKHDLLGLAVATLIKRSDKGIVLEPKA